MSMVDITTMAMTTAATSSFGMSSVYTITVNSLQVRSLNSDLDDGCWCTSRQ